MKLITWNVNGIRAAGRTTFHSWFAQEAADVVCVQEIKAFREQLVEKLIHPEGYHSYWHSAEKPGYSGVAIYSKKEIQSLQVGIGDPLIDREGRVLTAEFKDFCVINAYFPNSQPEHGRLGYKLAFCEAMLKYCNDLQSKGKNIVLCGDFNIAHKEIDLKNPKTNKDTAGYLPEERAWMDKFTGEGYIDTFRHFVKEPGHYTWWSYRPGLRERNIGWRIDYFAVNPAMKDRLKGASHQPLSRGSDHCPVVLELIS